MNRWSQFNIRSYLDSRGVEYQEEGKNISEGWIGLNCPFCPDGDPSNHLGINLQSKSISCWRCSTVGSISLLIRKIESIRSNESTSKILEQFSDRIVLPKKHKEKYVRTSVTSDELSKVIHELIEPHGSWLIKRGFGPDTYDKYKLGCFGPVGKYKLRLFIPFYRGNQLLTFTTRDVTDLSKTPYIHCSIEKSVIDPKKYLYNLDSVRDTAIIVEGVTDVWNIGDGSVATMGIKFIVEQLVLLRIKKIKRLFILFDFGKLERNAAEKLAYAASTFISHVEIIELSEGDPGDLLKDDVKSLRTQVFGKIF